MRYTNRIQELGIKTEKLSKSFDGGGGGVGIGEGCLESMASNTNQAMGLEDRYCCYFILYSCCFFGLALWILIIIIIGVAMMV